MARPKRSSVQKYHDRVAGRYDQSYEDEFWRWHDDLTWDFIRPYLPRDANAETVDLGCGTGKWGGRLAKSGFRVTGVDVSPKMLDKARDRWAPLSGQHPPRLIQADLIDLGALPDNTFHLALAMGDPIGCTATPIRALREIRRILRPDGILVASFDNRLNAVEFHLRDGGPRALSRFLQEGRTHWLTRDRDEQFEIHTYGPTDLRRLMESAGFAVDAMEGRTVLPLRHHRDLLADSRARREWARVERAICRDPAAMGRASHLHVAGRPIP